MAYDNNSPRANLPLNETVVPIKDNFAAIQTAFDVNHGSLTDIQGNSGKHLKVSYLEQATIAEPFIDTSPISAVNLGLTGATNLDLIFTDRRDSNQNYGILPLTLAKFSASVGWTYIAGTDLVLIWGNNSITTNTTNQTLALSIDLGSDIPSIYEIIWGHIELNTKTAPITAPMDAKIYLRSISVDRTNDLINILYTLRKRSAFNTQVETSILPLTYNYAMIGYVARGSI